LSPKSKRRAKAEARAKQRAAAKAKAAAMKQMKEELSELKTAFRKDRHRRPDSPAALEYSRIASSRSSGRLTESEMDAVLKMFQQSQKGLF
jgi:hypothetical protein